VLERPAYLNARIRRLVDEQDDLQRLVTAVS
jgi:hypothetical protein